MKTMVDDSRGFHATYGVELLFDESPRFDIDASLQRMTEELGSIDHKSADKCHTLFFHKYPAGVHEGNSVPSQIAILYGASDKNNDDLQEALQQSWLTENAADICAKSVNRVLFTDMMSSPLPYKDRMFKFTSSLKSLLKHSNAIGIHWQATQQIISVTDYLQSTESLYGLINIRFFNAGEQGMVMDSLGLSALGLYDVQCHFVNLEPNEMSRFLFNMAYYIYENEPTFENGHTVDGLQQKKWKVRFEEALIPPERSVLDINPGESFAAGNR